MKYIYILFLLALSIDTRAQNFGDLQPVPSLGNKWEVLTLGDVNSSKAEIVSITGQSVTKKLIGDPGSLLFTTNYEIANELCYVVSTESYADFEGDITHFKTEFSPKLRCIINASEMPYHEVSIAKEVLLKNGASRNKPIDRTYYFRGIENIVTPAGEFIAEKIEVKGSKTSRVLWRNKYNSIIKHEVTELESGNSTTTVLQKGASQ